VVDQAPQGALIWLEPYRQLIELFIETVRIERGGVRPVTMVGAAPADELIQSSDLAVVGESGDGIGRAKPDRKGLVEARHDRLSFV
jgi:hypothetical protein